MTQIDRWIATHPSALTLASTFLGMVIGYSITKLVGYYTGTDVFEKGMLFKMLDWYCNK